MFRCSSSSGTVSGGRITLVYIYDILKRLTGRGDEGCLLSGVRQKQRFVDPRFVSEFYCMVCLANKLAVGGWEEKKLT